PRARHGEDRPPARRAWRQDQHQRPHRRPPLRRQWLRQLAPLHRPRPCRLLHAGARRPRREAHFQRHRLRRPQAEAARRSLCECQPPDRDPAGDGGMNRPLPPWRAVALAAVLCLGGAPAQADNTLQPYQMIRALQMIQDRLADGDHAVLPMQRKALEMIDARLRASTAGDFTDTRNLNALLVYGMSGGNPSTVAATLSRLELGEADKRVGNGVVDYLRGESGRVLATLGEVDPLNLPPEVGAFVALVKGSVNAAERPALGYANLDIARLLAPGTLVEEAALRRTIALATQQGDAGRFLRAAGQYTRRF